MYFPQTFELFAVNIVKFRTSDATSQDEKLVSSTLELISNIFAVSFYWLRQE